MGELVRRYKGKPDYWRLDVERYTDMVHRCVDGKTVLPLSDYGFVPEGKRFELLRRLVTGYGALLEYWPLVWEAARKLRD